MWEIFKAELRYTRFAYFIFFVAIVLFVLLQAMSTGGDRLYVLWFVIAMALNFWNAKRIKEKRDYQLMQLPVSRGDVGKARALMIALVPAAGVAFYAIVAAALGPGVVKLSFLGAVYGLTVTVFALIFTFRDRFVGTKALMQGKFVIVAILAALFGVGLAMMISTEEAAESGAEPPALVRALGAVIKEDPFGNPLYMACFVVGSLVLAYVTVITFQRRKTNVE